MTIARSRAWKNAVIGRRARTKGVWYATGLAATACLICAGVGRAQVNISPAVQVDHGSPGPANEPAIAASEVNPLEVVAGSNDYRSGIDSGLGYGISLDGGRTWVNGLLAPPPLQAGYGVQGDPMVCVSPFTGDFWVGGLVHNRTTFDNGLYVARKPAGATTFNAPVVVTNHPGSANIDDDRCSIFAGPDATNPNQLNLYIAFARYSGPSLTLMVSRSVNQGATWGVPVSLNQAGQDVNGLVMDDGRVIVVSNSYTAAGILAKRSLNAGATWLGPAQVSGVVDPLLATDIPGTFRASAVPSVAINRATNTLYVAYAGRRQAGSTNLDIFVARSTDGGVTFPTRVRLTDAAPSAGAPNPNPDQFMPWVSVDAGGALVLLWYDTRHVNQPDSASNAMLDVYYGRLTDFGTPSQALVERRLTAASFSTGTGIFQGTFIGDYQQITCAGRETYAAYMKPTTGAGAEAHIFVNQITLCPCDWNQADGLDSADFFDFLESFFSGDADINGADGTDSQDYFDFLECFFDGC